LYDLVISPNYRCFDSDSAQCIENFFTGNPTPYQRKRTVAQLEFKHKLNLKNKKKNNNRQTDPYNFSFFPMGEATTNT
jgi:hypothetical protein